MNEGIITPFLFEGEAMVRVVDRKGDPWFVALDVCRVLGIEKHRDAVARLDPDERGSVEVDTLGGRQALAAVSEGGLYTLILRCRSATTPGTAAHRFRRWVTAEVLPAIRKTGRYAPPPPIDADPSEEEPLAYRLRTVTETRQSFGIAAAQQMWFELKLPIVPAMLAARDQADMFQPGRSGPGGPH